MLEKICNFYLLNNKDTFIYYVYVREAHQATRPPITFMNREIKKKYIHNLSKTRL